MSNRLPIAPVTAPIRAGSHILILLCLVGNCWGQSSQTTATADEPPSSERATNPSSAGAEANSTTALDESSVGVSSDPPTRQTPRKGNSKNIIVLQRPKSNQPWPTPVKSGPWKAPEAVYQELKRCLIANEPEHASQLLTRRSQELLCRYILTRMPFSTVQEKHGITEPLDEITPTGWTKIFARFDDLGPLLFDLLASIGRTQGFDFRTYDIPFIHCIDILVDGDRAVGYFITETNQLKSLSFQRQGDSWYIDFARDPGVHSFDVLDDVYPSWPGQANVCLFRPEIRVIPTPPLEVISDEQLQSPWKVNIGSKGKPALTLLIEIAKSNNLKLVADNDVRSRLSRLIDENLIGVSTVQALERICELLGAYPNYGNGEIYIMSGIRPNPATIAGPFAIIVTQGKERNGLLSFEVAVVAIVPTPLATVLNHASRHMLVTDDASFSKQSLYSLELKGGKAFSLRDAKDYSADRRSCLVHVVHQYQRPKPEDPRSTIGPFAGTMIWNIPAALESRRIDNPQLKTAFTIGSVQYEFVDISDDGRRISLRDVLAQSSWGRASIVGLNSRNKPVIVEATAASPETVKYEFGERVNSLDFVYVTELKQFPIRFKLPPIQLVPTQPYQRRR